MFFAYHKPEYLFSAGGAYNDSGFGLMSRRIFDTVQNNTNYVISRHRSLIGNPFAFKRCRNQRTYKNLNGHCALFCTIHVFSEPAIHLWIKNQC